MTNELKNLVGITEDIARSINGLSAEALTIVGIIALGYATKAVNIPRKFVPVFLFIAGPAIFYFMGSPGDAPPTMRSPIVHQIVVGVILSAVAWGAYVLVIKRIELWVKKRFGTGETEITAKGK